MVERVVRQGEGLYEKALHPHNLIGCSVLFFFGVDIEGGLLVVPILHHVHELDCLGGVDGALPAEPDIGIDVVGVGVGCGEGGASLG